MKKLPVFILLLTYFFVKPCNGQHQVPIKGTIKAGNLNVYYERVGKGDAILLLHAGVAGSYDVGGTGKSVVTSIYSNNT